MACRGSLGLKHRKSQRLAFWAMLAPPFYIATAIIATLLGPQGFKSMEHPISQLGAPSSPRPWIIKAGFVGYAILVQGLGPLLNKEAGGGFKGKMLWGLTGIYGLAGMLSAIFSKDVKDRRLFGMTHDLVHSIVGRVCFGGIMGLSLLAPFFIQKRQWKEWKQFSFLMFLLSGIMAIFYQSNSWKGRQGLLQRGFFATTMLWVFVTALKMIAVEQKRKRISQSRD
tara:strand:+ start:2224 stop:2898 length:675 start_codon:yes stop_codon:yes gene_type:complete